MSAGFSLGGKSVVSWQSLETTHITGSKPQGGKFFGGFYCVVVLGEGVSVFPFVVVELMVYWIGEH